MDNKEQCRAEFEAWALDENGGKWEIGSSLNKHEGGEYIVGGVRYEWAAWKAAWQASRATSPAPAVVQMTDDADYELHVNGEFQAGTSGKNAYAEILNYAAQYAEDGEVEIFQVTRTKIDAAILSASGVQK
jgi:hypothetical protein